MPDGPGRPTAPRWPQVSPKIIQDGPRTASRRFRVGPRWPDENHKTAGFTGPLRPRDAQDRSKKHHDVLGCAKPAPDCSWRQKPVVKHTTSYSKRIIRPGPGNYVKPKLFTGSGGIWVRPKRPVRPRTCPRQAQDTPKTVQDCARRPQDGP